MIDIAASLQASARQNADGTVKTVEDLARYETVIDRAHPACIVELGTFSGKSAVWFADHAECPVVTVDVHAQVDSHTRQIARGRVTWLNGSSTDPGVILRVWGLVTDLIVDGGVMVVCDSDHSADHVLAEMDAYAPLVSPGGYMVVEDGLLRYMDDIERAHYTGDPLDAIETWLPEHPGWEADETIEAMFPVTQFPSGWLHRRC